MRPALIIIGFLTLCIFSSCTVIPHEKEYNGNPSALVECKRVDDERCKK